MRLTTDAAPSRPAPGGELVRATGIGKSWGGTRALDGVDIAIRGGEILALVGENGAGKSTLMNILSGIIGHGSYEGALTVDGQPGQFANPHDSEKAGIVLVPQELRIAPGITVGENMFMGHLPRNRLGLVDFDRISRDARRWLRIFDMPCAPEDLAGLYSTAEQRMMMIAGALSKDARVLLLDEPTAALTAAETDKLFAQVLRLKAHDLGIVLITHRLDEVEAIADRVVVMRNGRVVHRMDGPKGRRGEIVRNMIGRDLSTVPRRAPETTKPPGEVVLDIRGLTVEDPDVPGKMVVDGLNLTLRAGEIHGLYGLVGAGRTEAARAIFGDWRGEVRGEVRLFGQDHRPRTPREAIRMGVTLLTEDRKATGILPGLNLGKNLSAASLGAVSRRGLISDGEEHGRNIAMMRKLDVRPCDTNYRIENLSGGNQQKILFGRWLNAGPRITILDEPTLGVDVGARHHIYETIGRMADEGLAVLMISSDVDEVALECDRVSVMYKGKITREFGALRGRADLIDAATGGQ